MSTPMAFDFAKFDYQIDPNTFSIEQVPKGRKKTDKSDEFIALLGKCQKELQKSMAAGQQAPLSNVALLRTFSHELETFLETKQLSAKTPYKLRQRPEQKKIDTQIAQLKELEAGFATISLRGMVKKVTQPKNEVLDIITLGKTLLSTPKPLQKSETYQEGQKAYVDALLKQKDLVPLITSDRSFDWLACFLQENPSEEAVQALLKQIEPLRDHESLPENVNDTLKTLLSTYSWLTTSRLEGKNITPAQNLFVSYLIDVQLPSRPQEPYLKEVVMQGFVDVVEGKSDFKWIASFIAQHPNEKEVSAFLNTIKRAQEVKLISPEAAKELLAVTSRFDALSQERKSSKLAASVRLQMAYSSQLLSPKAKSSAVQELYTESIERMFTPGGSLQWIKRFLQEKPSDEEVATVMQLLKFVGAQSLAEPQIKVGSNLLLNSFDELSQSQKEKKLLGSELLGLAYGIEVKLSKKDDPTAKQLLEEGLGRLFAIEGSLKGLERILGQEPTKAQIQDLVKILSSLSSQEKIGKKMQHELQGLIKTYTALSEKAKISPQEMLKVAYALHVDVGSIEDEKLLSQALTELMQAEKNLSSLEPLFAQDLSEPAATKLLAIIAKVSEQKETLTKIIGRFEQLRAMPKEQLGLSLKEMLHLAYFIEVKLAKTMLVTGPYIKKGQSQTLGLARSLLVDNVSGDVFVLSKRKVDVLDASGTSKRVTSAVRLPAKAQAQLVAQAVGKHDIALTDRKTYNESIAVGKVELQIHKQLQNGPGIWPVLFWCEYTKTLDDAHEIPKLTAIYAFADGPLTKIRESISGPELVTAARALIEGLAYMHALGFVHCDLKLENALFKYVDGKLIVGWSDFGLTVNVGAGQKPAFAIVGGYYGTHPYTAPEVWTRDNFDGDLLKADVWALGCCLYQLCYKEDPPWTGKINEYHSENRHLTEEERENFNTLIEEFAAEELQKLPPLDARSAEDHLKALTFQMLRADPAVRIDMATAQKQLQGVLASV